MRTACALALTLVAACAAGIELVTPDGTGFVQPLDDLVARLGRAATAAWLQTVARPFNSFDTIAGAAAMALVALTVVACCQPGRVRVKPIVGAAIATEAIVLLVQHVTARPAPVSGTAILSSAGSFPAPGTALLVALAGTALGTARRTEPRSTRRGARSSWLAAMLALVGIGMLTGAQWLTDELAGIAVGASTAAAVVGHASSRHRGRARRRDARFQARLGLAVLLVAVPPTAVSYWGALHAPGYAAADARTVDWLRTHGFNSIVDRAESWWLWTHLPSTSTQITALPAAPVPNGTTSSGTTTATRSGTPTRVAPLISPALPREGEWSVAQRTSSGTTQIATTNIRPDPRHPALVASIAWMNAQALRFALVAGTRQPTGHAGSWNGTVPPAMREGLLAAFNSGYKIRDTPGGAIVEGMTARTLQAGVASLVIHANGTATVGAWGRDATMTSDVIAVRQNLHLIITAGELVPGLRTNVRQQWGTVKNALPTWRSGLGVDRAGNLVYASGNQLTIDTLATALQRAGAVTAMELDIHNHMVTYNLFTHTARSTQLAGHKLSPDMTEPSTRYLQSDQRDFIAVFTR